MLRNLLCIALVMGCLFVVVLPARQAVAAASDRWFATSSGALRLPNSNQPSEEENTFAETLIRVGYAVSETDTRRFSVFAHGQSTVDTMGATFNNIDRVGIGLAYRWRVSKPLTLSFSARHDWSKGRINGLERDGPRYQIGAFYFRYWHNGGKTSRFGLPVHSTVLKIYGSLFAPGSLVPDDDNVVFSFGGDLAQRMSLQNTKWRFAIFSDLVGSWDADANSFNNKLIPAVGARVEYPLPDGSFFVGARLRADWRWVRETLIVKPGLNLGWFRTF